MPLPKRIPRSSSAKTKESAQRCLANRYVVDKKLGSGNFGTAWLVADIKTKDEKEKLKVVKEISVGDLQPDETVDAMHEASLLRSLDHPGIVNFHDSFIDTEFFCIVTEFCEGGDLDNRIIEYRKKKKRFAEAQVLEWTIQLLLALQYMHERRVLHRDLKTRNIFLRNNIIKIGDFGISRILMGTTDMASTFVGTPYYMSPEVLKHEGYNSKSDVWSIGCVLYELVALKHAFEGQSLMGVMYKIVEGNLPDWTEHYSDDLHQVFIRLCEKDPVERPSASEALKLPYIAKEMEALKNTMMDKHHAKENKEIVNRESHLIATGLKHHKRLNEIRKESEERKWKNLSPRERMRRRKEQEADKKAHIMEKAAKDQFINNKASYVENKIHLDPYATQLKWGAKRSLSQGDQEGSAAEQSTIRNRNSDPQINQSQRPHTAPFRPYPLLASDEDHDDDESASDDDIVIPARGKSKTLDPYNSPQNYASYDDRPITPMKDTMIYDRENSSLDFKDGIPDRPDLADTYYSQFDEFDDDDEVDDDEEGTLVAEEEEVEDLIHCMQNALDKSDTIKSQTLVADDSTGAFGPASRETKIRNLRIEGESKLGKDEFERAYTYLKEARFSSKSKSTADEGTIMRGLAKIVRKPSECFIVDQLLFLELQAELSHV